MTTILTEQENKTFYRQLITVGIPVLIQQLIVVGLNLVDTIMAVSYTHLDVYKRQVLQ